jgi:anti-anti-sigma regulatory factor
VVGEIDATNRVELIREVRDRVGAAGVRAVEIDAARLTFCDARSLLGLSEVSREVAARGLPLEIRNLAPHLVRLLDLLDGESTRFDHA